LFLSGYYIFHLQEIVHIMRSHRKMLEIHAFTVDLACASRISPKATHELMSKEVGGRANLGYTELDKKKIIFKQDGKRI
jgi:hypothetical protein